MVIGCMWRTNMFGGGEVNLEDGDCTWTSGEKDIGEWALFGGKCLVELFLNWDFTSGDF